MREPWLHVIGTDASGYEGLSPARRALVDKAETVIGAERLLATLPDRPNQERFVWPSPFEAAYALVADRVGRPTVVLASGDPLWHGVGRGLVKRLGMEAVRIHSAPSSFQFAAARLGWAMEEVQPLSLHAPSFAVFQTAILPGARLLLLVRDGTTASQVAATLKERGFGASRLIVLSDLGGDAEQLREATAETFEGETPALSVVAVEVKGDGRWHPLVPGVPDEAFRHDGKLTKRDLRAGAVARLAPRPGAHLWDVGAGCGSVGIEWARAARRGHVLAIEPREDRRAMIEENAGGLGVPDIEIVAGEAPDALAGLHAPDAIFIGGGLHAAGVAEACLEALKPGGALVAHAVTLESEAVLLRLFAERGGELLRHTVARADAVGSLQGWRPSMPMTQWHWIKP